MAFYQRRLQQRQGIVHYSAQITSQHRDHYLHLDHTFHIQVYRQHLTIYLVSRTFYIVYKVVIKLKDIYYFLFTYFTLVLFKFLRCYLRILCTMKLQKRSQDSKFFYETSINSPFKIHVYTKSGRKKHSKLKYIRPFIESYGRRYSLIQYILKL